VKKAKAAKPKVPEFHWSAYLGASAKRPVKKTAARAPKKTSGRKAGAARTAVDTVTAAE